MIKMHINCFLIIKFVALAKKQNASKDIANVSLREIIAKKNAIAKIAII